MAPIGTAAAAHDNLALPAPVQRPAAVVRVAAGGVATVEVELGPQEVCLLTVHATVATVG